jgi:hypothetical protein
VTRIRRTTSTVVDVFEVEIYKVWLADDKYRSRGGCGEDKFMPPH